MGMSFKYKMTLEQATRIARDVMNADRKTYELRRCDDGVCRRVEVMVRPSYHFTLKEIRAIINNHRVNNEALAIARAEHKDDPNFDYGSVVDWTEAHETRAFKRKDGAPYCQLIEFIVNNNLVKPEILAW